TWLTKAGPFWDDERFSHADDLFYFEGTDVTEQGLGEAARRRLSLIEAGVFSFLDASRSFARSPLVVDHGLLEDPLGQVVTPNCWSLAELDLEFKTQPASWKEMIEGANNEFDQLAILQSWERVLDRQPFDLGIANRILE